MSLLQPNSPQPRTGVDFGDPFSVEDVEAQMAHLHSLEDDGSPIDLPNDPNDPNDPNEPTEEPTPEETPEEPTTEETPETPSTPDPTAPPETVNFGGRDIPMEELRGLVQFNDWLTANPDAAERITLALNDEYEVRKRGDITPPPAPPTQSRQPAPIQLQEPQLPEDFDYEDPANRYIVDNIRNLRQSQIEMNNYLIQQQEKVNQGLIQQGINRFRENNPALSDQDMQMIIATSGQFDTLDRLVAQGRDIPTATVQSLDYAMWSIPSMRDALYKSRQETLAAQAAQDDQRKQKLTALSGGNGSTGRATPPPAPQDTGPPNLRSVPQAMVEDIRGFIGQNNAG